MTSIGTYRSSVTRNKSYRTTIPQPIAKALKLEHKGKILWELVVKDGEVFVVVRKSSRKGGE